MKPSEYMASKDLCKGNYYEKRGRSAHSGDCDSCCIAGAVKAAAADLIMGYFGTLANVIGAESAFTISEWNDRPETTKDDAIAALQETERRLGI